MYTCTYVRKGKERNVNVKEIFLKSCDQAITPSSALFLTSKRYEPRRVRSPGSPHEWEKSGRKSQSTDKSFFYFAAVCNLRHRSRVFLRINVSRRKREGWLVYTDRSHFRSLTFFSYKCHIRTHVQRGKTLRKSS